MNTQEKANALFEDQKKSWPLLGANWSKLESALLKTFAFDGFTIQVQYNPKRIVSSAAKVDRETIKNRTCFLCNENRPAEEKNLWFGKDYEILCNPFPIFGQHFTIVKDHTPQVIEPEFLRFLDLSRELPDLVVFYNGPACGASAPDHMHFQAGNRGFLPIEQELETVKQMYGKPILRNTRISVSAIDDGLRRFLLFESDYAESLYQHFRQLFKYIKGVQHGEEPMINMLSYYRDGWQVLIFPRERHRPKQYFEEGEGNILISPAAVDMGGTLIMPLEKDFNKITREEITDIFSQVSFSSGKFASLVKFMSENPEAHG